MKFQGLIIKQQNRNVLKGEHLGQARSLSLHLGCLVFFLQDALHNCSLHLLGEINVWQLYYTIDSNYCYNDRATQGAVTEFLEMS